MKKTDHEIVFILKDYLGTRMEISLAKPPSDKKKKEEMLRKREQRMMQAMAERWDNNI